VAFAGSSVLQQRAAREAPSKDSLSWRLIADLLHQRTWLAGSASILFAYVLEAIALANAPVAVVEPVISTELVVALPLAGLLGHRRLGPRELAGAVGVSAGVASFMAFSNPVGGNADPGLARWGTVALPTLALAGMAIGVAVRSGPRRRAVLLACGAGLSFGLLALVTQSFVQLLGHGVVATFASWQPYTIAVLGAMGFTVGQSAYQAAPLAISLPIIDSIEPVSSVVLAALVFHQSLSIRLGALVAECIGGVVAIAGVVALSTSPLVLQILERQEQEKSVEPLSR